MRTTKGVLLWMLLALAAVSSRAAVVKDLHAATVPVNNQSSQALTAASREALADVLVKVSGSTELLQNPVIVSALDDARNHVQQYSYVRRAAPATGLALRFEFDGPFINKLVKRAGAPLWTANHLTVLAWVMVEDEQGRHFINKESAREEAAKMLVEEFSRRGVPVQLPVFDLADMTAVHPEDAWRLDANVMQAASARCMWQDVPVGSAASSSEGQLLGREWSYLYEEQHSNRAVTVPDLTTFLREGVNLVAGEMAGRYAVAPTGGGGGGIRMSVTGVTSYQDYAAIVRWLEGLELVDHANVDHVQGDRIELRLQAQASAPHLAATIELNKHLVPVALPAAVPAAVSEPPATVPGPPAAVPEPPAVASGREWAVELPVAEVDPSDRDAAGQSLQRQLSLAVHLRDDATFDNFLALPRVQPLVSALHAQLAPAGEAAIYMYGPASSGKSHLLQASCHVAAAATLYLPLSELRQFSPREVLQGVEHLDRVCIDDIHTVLGDADWELGLLHLFNSARQAGCRLVVAGDAAPRALAVQLADLRSRLSWGIVYQLAQADDADKAAILQFRADRRGLTLSPGVANYIVNRAPRALAQLLEVLDQLDKASLAQQRALSIPFVKAALGW